MHECDNPIKHYLVFASSLIHCLRLYKPLVAPLATSHFLLYVWVRATDTLKH